MDRNRLGKWLGITALCAWGTWWAASLAYQNLIGAEHLWLKQPWLGADFWSQTDYAARLHARGGDPYDNEIHLFHYPPIVIRLFAWTPLFEFGTARLIWILAIMALIALGAIAALRTRKELGESQLPAPLGVAAVLFTFPALYAIERSNFDLIVLVAILGGLRLARGRDPRRELLAGAVLAVAPWVKLYPGLIAVGLVAVRRFRLLAGFAIGGVLIGLAAPRETLHSFHIIQIAVRRNAEMAAISPYHPWMHSLSIAWIRITKALEGTSIGPVVAAVPPTVAALAVILPLLGWVSLAVYRANPRKQDDVLYPYLLWICALASFLPVIANDYSLVFLPMAAIAVYGRQSGRLAHVTMAAALPWWQPYALPIPATLLLACKVCAIIAVGESIVRAVTEPTTERDRGATPAEQSAAAHGAQLARRPLYVEAFTVSLGASLLLLAYTGIFTFKTLPCFTYVLLGVGLLGISAGGLALATSERLRRMPLEELVPVACFAVGAGVLVGYVSIAGVRLDITGDPTSALEMGKLLLVLLLLAAPFAGAGVVLAAASGARSESRGRFRTAALLGAASGSGLATPLIGLLSPPRTVILAGLVVAVAGLPLARAKRTRFLSGLGVAAGLALPTFSWGLLPDPIASTSKGFESYRSAVMLSSWDPVVRVDVAPAARDPVSVFLTFQDGVPGSVLRYFDGKLGRFRYLDGDSRSWPFEVVRPAPKVLVLGAAGGHEVVASLYFRAAHVTGVELDPVTYSLITTTFAGITGRLAENPRATLLASDARGLLRRTNDLYDLVWLVAPDSSAVNAAAAGAFVLAEEHLYTVETAREVLRHLTPDGVVCAQFSEPSYDREPNRTARYLATSRAAFAEEGIADFDRHVLAGTATGPSALEESTVLTGRKAFTTGQIAAFVRRSGTIRGAKVRGVPGQPPDETPVSRVVDMPEQGLSRFFAGHPYRVNPVRDDAPFFFHFTRFRDAFAASPGPHGGVTERDGWIAERTLFAFLAASFALAALLVLLPLAVKRDLFRDLPSKGIVATHFAALAVGPVFIAAALVEELSLLLGYTAYSLPVTLFALLSSAAATHRFVLARDRACNRTLLGAFGALALLLFAGQAMLPALVERFAGSWLGTRVLVSAAVVAPLGLCLGVFLPFGVRTVGALTDKPNEYVAWARAVHGFFCALAPIASTILARVVGFKALLGLGLAAHAVALLAIVRSAPPRPQPGSPDETARGEAT